MVTQPRAVRFLGRVTTSRSARSAPWLPPRNGQYTYIIPYEYVLVYPCVDTSRLCLGCVCSPCWCAPAVSARKHLTLDIVYGTLHLYRLSAGAFQKLTLGVHLIEDKQTRHESWKSFQTPWGREKALRFSPCAGGRWAMVFLLVVSARVRFGVPLFWFCFRQPRRVRQARVWYLRFVGAIYGGRRSMLRTSRGQAQHCLGEGVKKVKMLRKGAGYGQLL